MRLVTVSLTQENLGDQLVILTSRFSRMIALDFGAPPVFVPCGVFHVFPYVFEQDPGGFEHVEAGCDAPVSAIILDKGAIFVVLNLCPG